MVIKNKSSMSEPNSTKSEQGPFWTFYEKIPLDEPKKMLSRKKVYHALFRKMVEKRKMVIKV